MDLGPVQAAGVLAGLVQTNLMQISEAGQASAFPVLRGLRGGQIRYIKADPHEQWQSWEAVLAHGGGDCEDLASAVAAELVAAGIPARPVSWEVRPGLWHVVVEVLGLPGTHWIDPSREGGMEGAA